MLDVFFGLGWVWFVLDGEDSNNLDVGHEEAQNACKISGLIMDFLQSYRRNLGIVESWSA